MQTTIISSHGSHCPYTPKQSAEVIKLPDNVIVLMHCYNDVVWSTEKYDSTFWSFATDSKLHLAMKKNKLTINNFAKFFKALQDLNDERNKLCVFVDKCPELFFCLRR
jgi:hypothetical protein